MESDADLTSTVTASGSVTFGYAGVTPIPTGSAVAKLVFTPKASGTTDVTITTTQINDTKVEITETVTATLPEIPVCEHASTEIRGRKGSHLHRGRLYRRRGCALPAARL